MASDNSAAYQPIPLPAVGQISPEQMNSNAAAFYAHLQNRHSVRHFSDRPVPREVIESCIQAAGTAPSGANHQPWHFACIESADIKHKIRLAAEAEERAFYGGKAGQEWLEHLVPIGTDSDKPFLDTAAWLIGIFAQRRGQAEDGTPRKNYYVTESVGIATGFLILALHNLGLATLTHTPKPMKFLNQICGRPPSERPYILLVAGYPAEDAVVPAYAKIKKPLSEIATFF